MIKQKLLHLITVQSLTRCLPLHLKHCTLEIALTMGWVLGILCYLLCFVWQYQWSLDSGIEVWSHMLTSAELDFYLSYISQSWLIIRDDWLIDHLDVSPWASSLSSLTRWRSVGIDSVEDWLIPEYIFLQRCFLMIWWRCQYRTTPYKNNCRFVLLYRRPWTRFDSSEIGSRNWR